MGDGFSWEVDDLERSAEIARSAWAVAKEAIISGRYQLVVLDEVTYPVNWGWIDGGDVAAYMRPARQSERLPDREGRPAGPLVDVADTVTEMRNVKHAYESGIRAAKGIDF